MMFLYRLAAGLVFLTGVGLSRLGVGHESWPLLALGLLAATVGLWHFVMGGSASDKVQAAKKRGETRPSDYTDVADVRAGH